MFLIVVSGKLVVKKWSQIRDTWMRGIKKQKQIKKTGEAKKPSKLYVFHEQMSFLKKLITDTDVAHESTDKDTNEEINEGTITEEKEIAGSEESHNDIEQSQKKNLTAENRRKRKINEVDAKMMTFIDHQISASQRESHKNRHLTFFESLLPSMTSLTDDETLEFQAGVIGLLRNIKRQKQTLPNNRPQINDRERQQQEPSHYDQSCMVISPQPQLQTYPSEPQHPSYSSQPQYHSYSSQPQYQSYSQPQLHEPRNEHSSQLHPPCNSSSITPSLTPMQSPLSESLHSSESQHSFDADLNF